MTYLRRVFQRHAELFHVAPELFDPLQVGVLHSLCEAPYLSGELLQLGDLPGPDAGALLVGDKLHLEGEYLGVLVEHLKLSQSKVRVAMVLGF